VQASPALGARNRIHTLHLCHDLTGVTLLTGFHIQASHAHTLAPQLLSRGRLMFIAAHPERFSDRIAAENPGLTHDDGRCPFWDAVGRRFLGMDTAAAEALAGGRTHKNWIAELLPQSPVYVPLLPEEAQWSLGQLHPVGELPFGILMDEGFDGDTYVNVFDGGPTADSRVALLKTVARRTVACVSLRRVEAPADARLAAGGRGHGPTSVPRCCRVVRPPAPWRCRRPSPQALGVAAGDWLDVAALDAPAAVDTSP
jgi:arginine N-succinyltransferase